MSTSVRPLRADGEATRTRILEAAGELFASVGLAEATNKMIAARAEVDLASINYHFGSRSGLYQAVLVEAHRRFVSIDSLQRLAATDLPARGKLRRLMELLVEGATADAGWHARVLGRELIAPSSHAQVLQKNEIPAKAPFVAAIVSEITGIPVGDPSLLRCLISIMAPCVMLMLVRPNDLPFTDEIRRMPREALIDHLYTFAIGGLEALRDSRRQAASGGLQRR
jgi:AcrR family transcriptional regulator